MILFSSLVLQNRKVAHLNDLDTTFCSGGWTRRFSVSSALKSYRSWIRKAFQTFQTFCFQGTFHLGVGGVDGEHTPLIPAPKRQKDLEFKASLGCTVTLCLRKPNIKMNRIEYTDSSRMKCHRETRCFCVLTFQF